MQRRAFLLSLAAPALACNRDDAGGTASATAEPTLAASVPVDPQFQGCTA